MNEMVGMMVDTQAEIAMLRVSWRASIACQIAGEVVRRDGRGAL